MYLSCCRWEYIKMQSGDDSLWESFPHALETLEGARRYISVFRALLQELSTLNPEQIHTLQACSLLAIPPPIERTPPPGGFPTDLSELNLSGWATLVQDVVAGLQVLPPNLGRDMVSGGPTPATRGVHWNRFLPLLLQPGLLVQVQGSLPTGPPSVMEPDGGADSRVWSDCLLWRHDHS